MARDRKRARQRKVRQGVQAAADVGDARPDAAQAAVPSGAGVGTPATAAPLTSSVPAAVEHASGDVEEFDAAMARGAAELFSDSDAPVGSAGASNGDASNDLDELSSDANEAAETGLQQSTGAADSAFAQRDEAEVPVRTRRGRGDSGERRLSLFARATGFLRASWAELQRMQWPNREHTSQATAVVLGFVVVAGVYLGVADWVAQKIVNFILG